MVLASPRAGFRTAPCLYEGEERSAIIGLPVVIGLRLWHNSLRPARKGAEAVIKQKILAIICAIALALGPVVAMAQDSGLEQGSLARTGTGVAQIDPAASEDDDCLIPDEDDEVDGCALWVWEAGTAGAVIGGVVLCIIFCSSGGGGGITTTTTTTPTTTTTTTTTATTTTATTTTATTTSGP